jgi:hypothetical protein
LKDDRDIQVGKVSGDVIGVGVSGSGNIIGNHIIQGGVIILVNPSKEAVEALLNIRRAPTELHIAVSPEKTIFLPITLPDPLTPVPITSPPVPWILIESPMLSIVAVLLPPPFKS